MIDNIFGNRTNVSVLRFLTKFHNQFFTKEEISKETGAGLRNVYDSIKILLYEKAISKKNISGKTYYKFVIDSKVKELIYLLFQEEQGRLTLRTLQTHKILSEIESRIIKITGSNLIDILLFGSIAKGRDTINSDIDLCIILDKHKSKMEDKIRKLSFENKLSRDLQIHVFTSKEFIGGKQNKNPLIMSILRDGISLRIGR